MQTLLASTMVSCAVSYAGYIYLGFAWFNFNLRGNIQFTAASVHGYSFDPQPLTQDVKDGCLFIDDLGRLGLGRMDDGHIEMIWPNFESVVSLDWVIRNVTNFAKTNPPPENASVTWHQRTAYVAPSDNKRNMFHSLVHYLPAFEFLLNAFEYVVKALCPY